jgi:hypothetical protein
VPAPSEAHSSGKQIVVFPRSMNNRGLQPKTYCFRSGGLAA